jgi:2-haloacid dehalogenase
MRRIRAAVFDLGGVLIDWDPRHLYRKVFGSDEAAMERFLETVCTAEWNAEQDRGRLFSEAIAELVAVAPEHRTNVETYFDRWGEMLGEQIPGTESVLIELRSAGIRLYGLSNWSAETFPIAVDRFPCLSMFDGIVVSGSEGVAKPDPAIFEILCERYGLDPAACLFVDDAPANVRAAREAGFAQAIDFTSAAELRSRLLEIDVLR